MLSCTAIPIPKFWNQVFLSGKWTKSGAIFLKMKLQCETAARYSETALGINIIKSIVLFLFTDWVVEDAHWFSR